MITLTLTINAGAGSGIATEKQLPTCWDDVTWQDFVALSDIGFGPHISTFLYANYYIAGSRYIVTGLENEKMWLVQSILDFLQTPETMLTQVVTSKVNIKAESWGKLEKAKAANILAQGNLLKCGAELVRIYTGEEIKDKPVTLALPLADFFFNSYTAFLMSISSSLKAIAAWPRKWLRACRTRANILWENLDGWVRFVTL